MRPIVLITAAVALLASPVLAQVQGSGEEHRDLDSMGLNPQSTVRVPGVTGPAFQGSAEEHRDLDSMGLNPRSTTGVAPPGITAPDQGSAEEHRDLDTPGVKGK